MTSVVCGASGFIGGALIEALRGRGARGWATARGMDLTTPEGCHNAVGGAELVYLCAGVTGGSGLIQSDPLSLVTPNLLIHAHMFAACKAAGVRKVVCISSTTGYPDSPMAMREEMYFEGELHPAYFNPGHTRRFIERLGAMYADCMDIVFLRPSVVYGPGDNFDLETGHVIPALVRKVAERQNPIVLWGDGSNWRDGVYIDDMVRALVLAAEAPAGAYNIACGDGMTVNQMLHTLIGSPWDVPPFQPAVQYDNTRPAMLHKRQLVTDKARNVLGWEPAVRMEEGLRRTLDWYRGEL